MGRGKSTVQDNFSSVLGERRGMGGNSPRLMRPAPCLISSNHPYVLADPNEWSRPAEPYFFAPSIGDHLELDMKAFYEGAADGVEDDMDLFRSHIAGMTEIT